MSPKRKSPRKGKVEPATETPKFKHMFDPACECADCLAKRGKNFQYIRLIPNLPDGSVGICNGGKGPDDALPKHLHDLEFVRLGVGKGRRELRQEAAAIRQVPDSEAESETLAVNGMISLTPENAAVLRALLQGHPVRMTAEKIAEKVVLCDKTIRKNLKELRCCELVIQPTPKKGFSLSPKGVAKAEELPTEMGTNLLRDRFNVAQATKAAKPGS